MENRGLIKEGFRKFIISFEKDSLDVFDSFFLENTEFEVNTLGNFIGVKEAKKKFKWQGSFINYARYKIYNNTIFQDGVHGIQSAYVVATVGDIKENYLHYFHFSGHYLNYWVNSSDGWKIEKMKYCHDMEFGNTSFVGGWWKLLDYSIFNGYDKHPIYSKKEAPWRLYDNYADWSEEEKIMDAYNRYAWGIDENDFEITESGVTEDVISIIGNITLHGKTELMEMLKSKRTKENTMSHVAKIDKIIIRENRSELFLWRYEPHRIGTKILNISNMNELFYSVKYHFCLENTDNIWKIQRIIYNVGVFEDQDDGLTYQ